MPKRSKLIWATSCFLLLGGAMSAAQQPVAPAQLKQEIERLRVPEVAWRHIPWNPCLLDGLQEARREGKPALLWVFIDRPADDARC
ncbi:MAG: hypothetical protein MK108_10220 [Mariniblastus sp.]|nr:hypothetical protein [Mariniblastus sp.]